MAFVRKTWKDRVSEKANRRTLTIESQDASKIVCTVERSEGEVSQEGDAFNGDNMNDLEERIASGLDEKLDGTKLEADTTVILAKTQADGAAPDCYAIKQLYDQLKKLVVDGKQALADAINAQGITTTASSDMSFADLAALITSTGAGRYSNGYNEGQAKGKQDGNASGYQTGYNEGYAAGKNDGIAYADGRANGNSTNYQSGYNAGVAAGKSAVNGSVSASVNSGSRENSGDGVYSRTKCWGSATASISNGCLTVSLSIASEGEGARWIDQDYTNNHTASASANGSNAKQVV